MNGARLTKRLEAGFSLMELLVALTILALAMGVVSLSVSRRSPTFEMRKAVSETVNLVREARTAAQSSGRAERVEFDPKARRITGPGDASVHVPDGIETSLVSSALAVPLAIVFFPDGSSTGGKLTFEIPGRRETVTVDWLTSRVGRESTG